MMDLVLEAWMTGLIEWSKLRYVLGAGERWKPGRPLKLLFVGYNGARNTGSDVRVDGMVRQIRHVLGPQNVELAVLTQDFALTRGYFGDARQVKLKDIFPPFLYREVPRFDGVITCEGSMFKSKFADALTVMMVGALGIASAFNKISVGYGAGAGHMNVVPRWMVKRYCRESLVVTRSEESRALLGQIGVPTELGTDTAWTFEPQRAKLWEKSDCPPHVLVMTATPIPRTLAMTLYGDLDVSVIDEMPPGRKPIETVALPSARRADVVSRIRDACTAGRQAYWVCPLIEESETLELETATDTAQALREALPD